jgi:hypothetical protein
MREVPKQLLAAVLVVLLATGVTACGGGDSSDATMTATAEDSSAAEGSSAAFRTPGGDNSIQNFGEEADAGELEAATATLTGFMQARAKSDWAKQCFYLAKAAIAPLEQLASRSPQLEGKGCVAILAQLGTGAPPSTRADAMTDGVASLRVEGNRGFALYHGARGVDYFVPMTREEGEWKVGALAPSEFP